MKEQKKRQGHQLSAEEKDVNSLIITHLFRGYFLLPFPLVKNIILFKIKLIFVRYRVSMAHTKSCGGHYLLT